MAPKIDPAILEALALDPETTTITSHGGSGFSSTFKMTSRNKEEGKEMVYFMKMGRGEASEIMFEGEHASLNAIHNVVPSLCPRSYAHGQFSNGSGSFLVTDFITMTSRSTPSSSSSPGSKPLSLAAKLAHLHSTPAPIPEGFEKTQFGFPAPTCCGDTVQDNTWKDSWADFFAENRLRHVLKTAEGRHGVDTQLRGLVERTAMEVVPALLEEGHLASPDGKPIMPVLVHGDLWSGNHGRGILSGEGEGRTQEVEEVVFDPSSCYAHGEFEWGIMRMFGGFGGSFEREYHKIKAKDEPVGEWEDRGKLYELYHHLNHYSIFGGGYKGGAASIMRELLKKYGGGGG